MAHTAPKEEPWVSLVRHTFYPVARAQRRFIRHANNLAHPYVCRRGNVPLQAASTRVLEVSCNAGSITPSCLRCESPLLNRVDNAEWCVEQATVCCLIDKLRRQPVVEMISENIVPDIDGGACAAVESVCIKVQIKELDLILGQSKWTRCGIGGVSLSSEGNRG